MQIFKNILFFLVGIVLFLVGLVLFAPLLVILFTARLITSVFTIILFSGLLMIVKGLGGGKKASDLVKDAGLEVLDQL